MASINKHLSALFGMHSQTQTVEKTYSIEEIKRIKEVFSELRAASKNIGVRAYVVKVKAMLKA